MQKVDIKDYRCTRCQMPSVPGECELCRNRIASTHPPDLSGIQALKMFLTAALWVSVLGAIFYILGFVATMP